jgi:hypothetical protein
MVIDTKIFKTFFIFLDKKDAYTLNKRINIEFKENYYFLDDILTRKELISMFQNNNNEKIFNF